MRGSDMDGQKVHGPLSSGMRGLHDGVDMGPREIMGTPMVGDAAHAANAMTDVMRKGTQDSNGYADAAVSFFGPRPGGRKAGTTKCARHVGEKR